MWSKTPNAKWPKDKIPTAEESESGDPRFIRTQFNVLLKETKPNSGNWKAGIERDQETKTESADITETAQDQQIIKDLFGTDKNDNSFTAFGDILLDSTSSSSSSVSSNSNTLLITAIYQTQSNQVTLFIGKFSR
jgi:hypothetical protein